MGRPPSIVTHGSEVGMPNKDPEKRREAQRRHYRKHKERVMGRVHQREKGRREEFFTGKSCLQCGKTDKSCLQIHHFDREDKVANNSTIWGWVKERRQAELAKCIVLCKPCHLGVHAKEMRKEPTHGTKAGYTHHKCRCDACKAAYAGCMRKWRARKKAERLQLARR